MIDWDLPPWLESLVTKHINAFKSHLLYYAGIGSVYYKNHDDELTQILIYNIFCYGMLIKADPGVNVWSDSAEIVAQWLDDDGVELLAQCGSYILQDSCELLSTTPSQFIQFSIL
jgi:hypothetical protein